MLKNLVLSVLSVFSLSLIGCAEPPTQELDAAQVALDQAASSEAAVYASSAYEAATDSLKSARQEVQRQEARWFKNFENAKTSAIHAREMATRAKSLAESTKTALRKEAEDLIARVSSAIVDARAEAENAPRGKGADDDLDQINTSLLQADQKLNDARTSLAEEHLHQALEYARTAGNQTTQVRDAVLVAVQKIETRKKGRMQAYRR